jgi:hypothetical protein
MVDEPHSMIVFTNGEKAEVRETPQEIKDRIEGAASPHLPLVNVTEPGGTVRWINALAIVEFHELHRGFEGRDAANFPAGTAP